MPVKVRCSGCEKVLNAPDKARGKAIKCPSCGGVVKVPAGDAPIASGGKKKPAKSPDPMDSDDFLANLDVDQLESESGEGKVCPYCAADMAAEDTVCRKCGMNTVTGQMDAKEAKKRARKGADPALYYGAAWNDSWAFLKQYWRLGMKTSTIWMGVMTLALTCFFMIRIWVFPPGWTPNAPPPEGQVMVSPEEGASPERSPWVAFTFWAGLGTLFSLGVPGWFWSLSLKITDATMAKEEIKEDRVNFDLFESMALGLRSVFWPFVVMFPLIPVWAGLMYLMGAEDVWSEMRHGQGFNPPVGLVAMFVAFFAIPYLFFPQAMVHMTMKHRYKAWIFWEQAKIFIFNAGATLYWWVVALIVFLPIVALIGFFLTDPIGNYDWAFDKIELACDKIVGMMFETGVAQGDRSLMYMICASLLIPLILLPVTFVLGCLMGFPAVLLMRATGLYGYYRREYLDLVAHLKPGQLVPFWVRFLCHVVDVSVVVLTHLLMWGVPAALVLSEFPMGRVFGGGFFAFVSLGFVAIAASKHKQASIGGLLMGGVGGLMYAASSMVPAFEVTFGYLFYVIMAYNYWLFFAVNEGSTSRSTIGKEAFGVVVQRVQKGAQLTVGQASYRHLGRLLSDILCGLPYLVAAFHPKKQAMHDLMAKTEVVFRGDK